MAVLSFPFFLYQTAAAPLPTWTLSLTLVPDPVNGPNCLHVAGFLMNRPGGPPLYPGIVPTVPPE